MKQKQKKNKRPGTAVYQFPYYKNDKGFLRIFLTKALFTCALAFSGAGLFTVVLEMDVDMTVGHYAMTTDLVNPVTAALLALIVCLGNFILLGFFRKLYVLIADAVAFFFFFSTTQLLQSAQDMLYQIFRVADGSIVKTAGILTQSEIRSPIPFFMLLIFIYGVLCAFASFQRFRPLAVMTYAEIMMIPAFLGQSLHFSWWLAVLLASLMGSWAVTVAAAADATLSSGYSSNLHMSDYVYLKANKKLTPAERLRSSSLHFGKHLSHCFTVFTVVLLIMGITATSFPSDGSMRLEDIANSTADLTKNIGYWFYDLFGGSGFTGFFSADGGNISISGSIDPEDTPTGNRPVAEIVTQNTDKLYLKGDIGHSFSGDKWESIAELDYGDLYYGSYNSIRTVLDSYAPEMQYYLMRYRMTRALTDGFDYIKTQTVKVNYLQDINTLLIAGVPYVFNYRTNNNFSIYGDFVAVADQGKVNSMRTAMMYCNDDSDYIQTLMTYRDYNDDISGIESEWDSLPMPVSYYAYTSNIASYREFVYDYYTDVPDEELENISGFLSEVIDLNNGNTLDLHDPDNINTYYHILSSMRGRNHYAQLVCEYLSSSGAFKYSLNIDNSSGSNTFLGNFLNETRAGHCALYATTMCLAMRYAGIPARYVTGFTVGGSDKYEKTEEGYSYTLLEKDLHAWVEVYFDDVGWIPYDPTPARRGGTGYLPAETTTSRTTPVTYDTPEVSGSTTSLTEATTTTTRPVGSSPAVSGGNGEGPARELDPQVIRIILIAAGAIVIALIIALSIAGALKTLRRKERTLIRFFRTGDAAEAVGGMFAFTLKILEIKGVQRKSGETPTEFAKRADHAFRAGLGIGLEQAMPLFERAEFDNAPVFSEEERQEVYGAVSKLYGELMLNKKGLNGLFTRIKLFGKVNLRGKDK